MRHKGLLLGASLLFFLAGLWIGASRDLLHAFPQLSEVERPAIPRQWGELKASDGLWFVFEDGNGTIRAFDSIGNRVFVYRRGMTSESVSAPPTEAPKRIRVGGAVQQARLLSQVPPEYPALARQAGIQGTVRLQAVVATDGSVAQLEVVSGHPLLVQAAMDAVRKWRYQRTLLNGVPVEVSTTIDVVFTLSD